LQNWTKFYCPHSSADKKSSSASAIVAAVRF